MQNLILSLLLLLCSFTIITKYPNQASKRVAFGSCSNQTKIDEQLWKEVLAENPNMWLWLGDIIYADTEDMQKMKADYDLQKSHPGYQMLEEKVEILGIWDDHDLGGNDQGSEYPMKDESRDLLFDFLDLDKDNDAWRRKGAYQSYTYDWGVKQVKIILLDTRYFRDSLTWILEPKTAVVNETGGILGDKQWAWLATELDDPDIDLFLVISGIQVLPQEHRFEKWANFPVERERLLNLISGQVHVPLILLSGDRHISEVSKLDLEGYQFPLYEITSSSLTNPWEEQWEEANALRIGQIIYPVNFAVLDIAWLNSKPTLELKFVDKNNKRLQAFSISY